MRPNLDRLSPGDRQPVLARNGAVATSQPLASAVGLQILTAGGNAVDAAIAMAAALTVVEPPSNGIGGDAFALVWDSGHLHGLNGSGRSPAAASADRLRARGLTAVPLRGWDAVTVPGAVRAWADLHARFGRLPFPDLMEPAASYAEQGHPVSNVTAAAWARAMEAHRSLNGPEFASFASHFAPDGRAPRTGETWRSPDMAATLREIGATAGESFYTGRLASAIADFAAAHDAALAASDLAAHRSEWVEPISARYRDHEVWEIPPNGQGIAALEALRILDGFPAAPNAPRTATWHREIEAIKLALTDAYALVSDPDHVAVPVEELLSDEHVAARRALITDHALTPTPRDPRASGTVYLCTADAEGQMVSFIQSNFHGFGAHLVVPGTGIALQNRGFGFSLTQGHPNELAPSKRPFHTIIPGFLTQGGQPVGPFGVMGGDMQAQGHVQLVVDTVDHRTDPQSALGRPRFRWVAGRRVEIEPPAGSAVLDALAAHGHEVAFGESAAPFGRGQAIWRLPDGTLVAGTDPRADGLALGY